MASAVPANITAVDIAIIGGGIAGASLAITMQRAGWQTAVIEREPVFRDRVRGEACHPWGVKELLELDLMTFVHQIGGLELPVWTRYRDREEDLQFRWDETFPGTPPEIGFNHPELQEALLTAAAEAGAIVHRPAQAAIARIRNDWLLQIENGDVRADFRAKFLVAADGKNSGTRKLWGGETVTDPAHHSFGGMLVKGIQLPQDSAHQGFYDAGFSMVFPQGEDRWRVYLVGSTDMAGGYTGTDRASRYLHACAACFPADAFANAKPAGPLAFFPNSHVLSTRIAGPMAVAIGDAAGAADPSQGHGMSLVWRDVREVRDLLLSHDLEDVPAAYVEKRRAYEDVLRTHAAWVAPLIVSHDDVDLALQAQVEIAREADPTALGFAGIFAHGPDSLPTDNDARARFFGQHLVDHPVIPDFALDKID